MVFQIARFDGPNNLAREIRIVRQQSRKMIRADACRGVACAPPVARPPHHAVHAGERPGVPVWLSEPSKIDILDFDRTPFS